MSMELSILYEGLPVEISIKLYISVSEEFLKSSPKLLGHSKPIFYVEPPWVGVWCTGVLSDILLEIHVLRLC